MQLLQTGGTKREAVCIQSITDASGNTIFTADTTGEKVLDTSLTEAATEVMEGVITNGTGRSAAISNGQPAAGKTGTSENWARQVVLRNHPSNVSCYLDWWT